MANVLPSDQSSRKTVESNPNCPNCSSEFIKRIRRTAVSQRLVSLFYIYPFSCQLCGHVFSLFQPGVRYVRVDEDQREHHRIRVDLPITLMRGETHCEGLAIEISMRGCTVKTQQPLAIASIVNVGLKIPNEKTILTVEAAIIRNSSQDRLGVEFLRFHGGERQRLRQFVHNLLSLQYR